MNLKTVVGIIQLYRRGNRYGFLSSVRNNWYTRFVYERVCARYSGKYRRHIIGYGTKATLHAIQQYAFPIGIFFLMFFLLAPVTSGKVSSDHIMKVLTSPIGWGSIVAGFIVSCIGGKGVGVLPMNPTILVGVLIGTLLAVLFAKGLPAGLLIAAGIIAIISMK